MQIDELVVFKPKTKAVAEDVNNNFEKLRVSNNEQEEFLNKLQKELDDYKLTPLCEIQCNSEILELNEETNNFRVSGTTSISAFTGITNIPKISAKLKIMPKTLLILRPPKII